MSEALHIHDEEGHDIGFVCVPGLFKYQACLHRFGSREWEPIGKPTTLANAFRLMGAAIQEKRRAYPRYNRAGIWAVEQGESYYEPQMAYEVIVR